MAKKRQAKATTKTVKYQLEGIPEWLWYAVKIRAARDRRTIRDVLLEALRKYSRGVETMLERMAE